MQRVQQIKNHLNSFNLGYSQYYRIFYIRSFRKNILIIGSGLMAETLIDFLLQNLNNHIMVASLFFNEAKSLVNKKPRCWATQLDITNNNDKLDTLVKDVDLVVAYVPPQFIVPVAKSCLKNGKHMVTSQYLFPELKAMDQQAKQKGIIFLNEIGLDPGIDHLATMKVKEEVESKGGKIIEYESWCGGLPAPECTNNPFGYKFSWSPIAAIKNINNDAKFIEDGQVKYTPASQLLYTSQLFRINPALILEGYPNRDSVPYKELYGLDECQKVIRGTLRYPGFCVLMAGLKSIGLGSNDPIPDQLDSKSTQITYLEYILNDVDPRPQKISKDFIQHLSMQAHTQRSQKELTTLLCKASNKVFAHEYYNNRSQEEMERDFRMIFQALDFLRFFDDSEILRTKNSHVENLALAMQPKMDFAPGEADFVVMQHIFRVSYPGDTKLKTIKSTLIMSGDKDGRSAMAQTVSIPCGIAAQLILDNKIKIRGVHMPNIKEINDPIIEELEKYGLMCVESEE